MATHRQTLVTLPSVQACFAAMDRLHADYKREYKRNATIALCYSLTATPVPGTKYTKDTHAVSLHAEDLGAQHEEVAWFERAALAL